VDKQEKEALEKYFLQFLNFEKQYPLLSGFRKVSPVASLLGLEEGELTKLREHFYNSARQAAIELLDEDEISEALESLPFQSGETIVSIGDSITDDLQGWFTIVQSLLENGTEMENLSMINSGISYNTTSEALRRLHRDVLSHDPDWVIVALGTFDAIRLNIAPNRTLLPLSETWENLNTIQSAIEQVTDKPIIWVSPPPVVSGLLEEVELFDFRIEEQDLLRIREIIAGKRGYHVDAAGLRMGNPAEAWYYLSDGINPSLSGHTNTVRELLKTLSTESIQSE